MKSETKTNCPGYPCPWSWLWMAPAPCCLLPSPSAFQELFKGFARHLSHLLTQKTLPGRSGKCQHGQGLRHWGSLQGGTGPYFFMFTCPDTTGRQEAQSLIKQFFHGHVRCESEADWHNLCGPQK